MHIFNTPLHTGDQSAVSLKHLGGELAPKLVYFVLKKELLKFNETGL